MHPPALVGFSLRPFPLIGTLGGQDRSGAEILMLGAKKPIPSLAKGPADSQQVR